MNRTRTLFTGSMVALGFAGIAPAAQVDLLITVENLQPANSVSFAPLRFGFHDGTFDSFDLGAAATAPIVSIAEGGSGSEWFPAFAAAQPSGNAGSVGGGPLLPGQTASAKITVDSSLNRFFSFGAMVVPSNDYFIGNDSGTEYELFDASGAFVPTTITQFGRDIWDAGSELDGPFGAAFLQGSSNPDHIDENGVVVFDFADLDVFNGLTTAPGYTFQNQIGADDGVYRITFQVVPAPTAAAALAAAGFAAAVRRRR